MDADAVSSDRHEYELSDRYGATSGTVVLSGLQALTRVLLDRHRLDARNGMNTGGVVSGYPGSPLGGFDLVLSRASGELLDADVRHVPGVNEELAAAAVWGTQQSYVTGLSGGRHGLFGMWYGKSPGADRCGDVFKHANALGADPMGGVLAVVGDDPGAKSSSLPSQSETVFSDAMMPVLYPSDVQELRDFGLIGYELSRFCGSWVGLKVVTNVADGVGSVDIGLDRAAASHPDIEIDGSRWRHEQRRITNGSVLLDRERDLLQDRMIAAQAFARHNGIDRIEGARDDADLGIVAAGKTYADLRDALASVGLDETDLERRGIRLLKLGMINPLDTEIVRSFAKGLRRVLVVEEKRGFVESALKEVLYGTHEPPLVEGKRDREGSVLVPYHGELNADLLEPILRRSLGDRLPHHEVEADDVTPTRRDHPGLALVSRTAAYCSGCPHNRSTVLPEGSVMGGGVGCHGMSYMDPRLSSVAKLGVVPMGSEGVPWIGLAPFTDTPHIFQNLGDGTYSHSGLLGIRACVAAGVNVTFKVLYNGYVAMTGGQDVAGGMSVANMTKELEAEGVKRIVVVADDPARHRRGERLARGVVVRGRDELERTQEELAAEPGVTVLIYDQVCAAEARRLRRKGVLPTPAHKVIIDERVCEGCGDCAVKSNCLSVQPVDTELGRKTQIHQTSCNRDDSCLDGDCPSFVTVVPARWRWWPTSRRSVSPEARPAPSARTPVAAVAEPVDRVQLADHYAIYLVGIGGTGVVTVNHLLATAARLEGISTTGLDQTGMSQKAGPVTSHLTFSTEGGRLLAASVGASSADLLLGFDLLSVAQDQHLGRLGAGKTRAVVSTSKVPTVATVTDTSVQYPRVEDLLGRLESRVGVGAVSTLDASHLAEAAIGDGMVANVVLLGAAYQRGLLPLGAESIESAIRMNGVEVEANIEAFRLGRRHVVDPEIPAAAEPGEELRLGARPLEPSASARDVARRLLAGPHAHLNSAVSHRSGVETFAAELVDFQSSTVASRYLDLVGEVADAEIDLRGHVGAITATAARALFNFMAYKDEYEVARLHLASSIPSRVAAGAEGPVRLRYHLHPPVLRALGLERKWIVGSWIRPVFSLLRSLRHVRGTRLDLFGYAHLRRVERALAGEYHEALVESMRAAGAGDLERLQALAETEDLVRGYEGVKLESLERFREAVAELREPTGVGSTAVRVH